MNVTHPLILFILKKNHNYDNGGVISNGLTSAVQFVVDMLLLEGYRARLETADNANGIAPLVQQLSPVHVMIEALWVTPAIMAGLQQQFPSVKWTVRVHSETPFLSNEGIAVEWIRAYLNQGVGVAFNSADTAQDFALVFSHEPKHHQFWLPDYYPLRKPRQHQPQGFYLDVGCFGAIRPMKNQLIQAMAAYRYSRDRGVPLRFHMNGSRVEQSGASNLKNIQALLGDQLVLHPWLGHEDFLELIASMDVCMQVSLSESFCVVASDAVSMGVPMVGSAAIKWLPEYSQARTDSVASIVHTLHRASSIMVHMNSSYLKDYLRRATAAWMEWAGF